MRDAILADNTRCKASNRASPSPARFERDPFPKEGSKAGRACGRRIVTVAARYYRPARRARQLTELSSINVVPRASLDIPLVVDPSREPDDGQCVQMQEMNGSQPITQEGGPGSPHHFREVNKPCPSPRGLYRRSVVRLGAF